MPVSGPPGCTRGGLTPLFVVVDEVTPGTIAVATVLTALLYVAAATKTVYWPRVLAVFVPIHGLALGHTDLDRYVSVPLSALLIWVLTRDSWQRQSISITTAIAGVVLTALDFSCDGPALVAIDTISLIAAATLLSISQRQIDLATLWTTFEFAALIVILASDPAEFKLREVHLTWQNIAAQAVWLFSRIRNLDSYIWLTVILLNSVVLTGVWFMSGAKCSLLRDAFDEIGPLYYFLGNFVLHYYPSLRLFVTPPTKLSQPARQVVVAVAVVVLYCATVDPRDVYGCDNWLHPSVITGAFTAIILVTATFLAWFGTSVLPKRPLA